MRLDPIGKTLPQLLQERARHDPGHLAQRHKDRGIWKPITWGAIAKNVEDFSNGLADLGLRKGDTLAIIGENEPELYQAEYAGLAQGAVIVCLYPDLTDREMEFILNNSCATMIVAQDQEQVDKVLSIRDPGLRAAQKR
jgi:long-chain acyl-CoA synthetase